MKNKLFHIITGMFIASFFCGCENSDAEDSQLEQIPAVLSGKAYTFEPDAEGEIWKAGKFVGMYMLKENTSECVAPYQNVQYQTTVEPLGYFTPTVKEDVLYYPQDGSKVDIIAYYPWKEDLRDNRYPLNVGNQTAAANFSFLYAGNGKGVSKDNNRVTFELRPVLSEVVFKLIAGDGVTDQYLEESVITVAGMNTKADFNLVSGKFEAVTEVKDISLVALEDANGASGQVFPAVMDDSHVASIRLPKMNREYQWGLTEEMSELKPGMRYTCSVTVGLNKIEVVTDEEPIGDWGNGSNNEVAGSENLIGTLIEDLPLGTMVYGLNDPLGKMEEGTWFYTRNNATPDESLLKSVVERDETIGHNVIHTTYIDKKSWFTYYMGYRMKNAKRTKYRITLKVKGTDGKNLRCFIQNANGTDLNTAVFVASDKTGSGGYNGFRQVNLKDTYQVQTLDFDFSKMVKDPFGHTADESREATDKALADFYIGFGYNSVANLDFYIAEISMTELK